ncbi:hypothetical protein [Brevundimonas sp. C43]|uniref:hypothetical protein n=1 Tax=Brevundimonas sp. C43 TaxID=3068314 RepID=UPI00273FA380|nr:hypothetical protein [Brevundimonas sp. C43]
MQNSSRPLRASVRRLSGAIALIVTAIASPALTKPVADNLDVGKTLNVAVTGRIVPRCEIQGGGDIDFGELTGGERATALFGLDCNVPFDLGVTSARGGLAHATKPQGEGPFSGVLPYDVTLTVPTLRPEPRTVRAIFSSVDHTGVLSSGDGIAAGGGKIEFRTRQPAGAGLLAGQYSETLTVTVTPRV